ncbi:hypothetical protein [Aquabacterium humicola]|uniref:hypothetical protein n=1 Tax=Aquabacterium humicola TaxID=3237377 RepID=UPI00254299F5|nr:hypothetical protein [Rubrivivax pictus]
MNDQHRAALALHAASADDRAWVLTQLAAGQREPLQALLDELESLGIPRETLQGAPAAAPAAAADGHEAAAAQTPIERLRRASAASMHAVLGGEPAGLTAAVLSLGPFAWRDECLALLPLQLRTAIEAHARPSAALADAALRAVAPRLAEVEQQRPVPVAPEQTPSRGRDPRMLIARWSRLWR